MFSAVVLWTVAYLGGLCIGVSAACRTVHGQAAFVGATLLLLFGRLHHRATGTGLLLLAVTLGVWTAAQAVERPPLDVSLEPFLELRAPTSEDEPLAPSWAIGQITGLPMQHGEETTFPVALQRLRSEATAPWRPLRSRLTLALTVQGTLQESLAPGDRLLVRATLRPPFVHQNPGELAPQLRAALAQSQLVGYCDADAVLRISQRWPDDAAGASRPGIQFLIAAHTVRQSFDRAIQETLAPPSRRAETSADFDRLALVSALVTGQRGALLRADQTRLSFGAPTIEGIFREAGIFHLLSISGTHLMAVAFLFYQGLAVLFLRVPHLALRVPPRRLAAFVSLPAVIFYTVCTGAEVATTRAAVVACVALMAIACGRRARPPEALALAALVLLHPAATPLSLLDPALQLSFAATLGAVFRPGRTLLPPPSNDLISRLAQRLFLGVRVSLGATLATAPLTAHHFGEVSFAGLVGNLLAIPIAEGLILPAGLLGAAVTPLCAPLGKGLLLLSGWGASLLIALAEPIASWGLTLHLPAPGLLAIGCYYVGLLLLSRPAPWLGATLCALGAGLACWPLLSPPQRLTVTFLDVGQADAAVLELPDRHVVVIDAGTAPLAGQGPVASYLRRRGYRHIDLLIGSHPHPDHIGGLPLLLQQFSVGQLWLVGGPHPFSAAGERSDPTLSVALELAARRGVPVSVPTPLSLGGVSLTPLWPCAALPCAIGPRPNLRHNDNSLVLRVAFAGRVILFPGDLELAGELGILDQHEDTRERLQADVLKAPHHCSRTSLSESFLQAVHPALAVCSVGYRNRYRFPHREIRERLDAHRVAVHRTDQGGALQVSIEPTGALSINPARAARSPAPR